MTQEKLDANVLVARYIGAKTNKETSFPIKEEELWIPIIGISSKHMLDYDRKMDWLYPVYQRICKFMEGDFYGLDSYTMVLVNEKFTLIEINLRTGKSIEILFTKIVE